MDRYDDVADAHRDLVQSLRDVYGEQGPPQPLLKNLKGPREGRRDEVSRMDIPAMRKAVEAYEHWYSVSLRRSPSGGHPSPLILGAEIPADLLHNRHEKLSPLESHIQPGHSHWECTCPKATRFSEVSASGVRRMGFGGRCSLRRAIAGDTGMQLILQRGGRGCGGSEWVIGRQMEYLKGRRGRESRNSGQLGEDGVEEGRGEWRGASYLVDI